MSLGALFPRHKRFVSTHWPARFLVHHGPLSRCGALLASSEFANPEAFMEAAARSRADVELWADRTGQRFKRASVNAEAASRLYASGLTFVCYRVETFVPAVKDVLYDLQSELDVPVNVATCHAYISTPGTGTRTHFDNHENFVVQISGVKRWTLAENESVRFPHEACALGEVVSPELERIALPFPRAMPPRARSISMRAGSALFVPRGLWHATETVATSVALTFVLESTIWADFLAHRLRQRLVLDPCFREPASRSPDGAERRSRAFVDCARSILCERGPSYVMSKGTKLHEHLLVTSDATVELEPRYAAVVRWMLNRRGRPFVAADVSVANVSPMEVRGIISFCAEMRIVEAFGPAALDGGRDVPVTEGGRAELPSEDSMARGQATESTGRSRGGRDERETIAKRVRRSRRAKPEARG